MVNTVRSSICCLDHFPICIAFHIAISFPSSVELRSYIEHLVYFLWPSPVSYSYLPLYPFRNTFHFVCTCLFFSLAFCPGDTKYRLCKKQATCNNRDLCDTSQPTMGCCCDDGLVLYNDQCINITQCPCIYNNKIMVWELNTVLWWSFDCTWTFIKLPSFLPFDSFIPSFLSFHSFLLSLPFHPFYRSSFLLSLPSSFLVSFILWFLDFLIASLFPSLFPCLPPYAFPHPFSFSFIVYRFFDVYLLIVIDWY